ncbi:MAG: phosphate ABC transporter permease [Sulfobacillus acidophilus]|uniref:Phosphate ABC transporter permease n=1 Tax=Sulfobacillus acidophilus TaxID=53633 RepID=A0A2T2WJ90_9FIRM|nr:MAG: phosphate ABC transporter permease [Sulfobacillus acidophilus]
MSMVRDRAPTRITAAATATFAVVGLGLIAALLLGAWPLIGEPRPLANLLGGLWDPLRGAYGLAPFFVGTVVVTATAMALTLPFSLAVAVVLSRPLPDGVRLGATRVLTVLTAVPSVIFGWWGLLAVVPWVRARFGGAGFSLLAAGLVLAIMVTPTLSLLFYQALRSVPRAFRDGSAALGATPDQTLVRMELPCALPLLIQAVLIAVARAVGETMAVQMVIGGQTVLPTGLTSPGATLTTQILTDMSIFPPGTRGHAVLDVMALVLMVGMYLLVRLAERWVAMP